MTETARTGTAATQPLARGLWGVLATPFTDDAARIDEDSLRREVSYLLDHGAVGLTVLGVFGEAARLTAGERLQAARVVHEAAPGTPLVLGIAERDTREAIGSARQLLDAVAGAEASLMVQIPSPEPAALAEHLGRIHDATGAGLVVQDYPVISGVTITSEQLLAGIKGAGYVAAVKSECPPTSAAIAELTAGTDAPVFGGLGGTGLLDELAAGAAGAMTGFSFPGALAATLKAWDDGGYPAARETFLPWLPLVNFEAQVTIGLAIRKASWHERGILASGAVRPPAPALAPALLPILRQHLAHLPAR
jgi:4-hydroxy-tetrahydrodipicolinate synthase